MTNQSVIRQVIEGGIIKTVQETVIAQAPLEAALQRLVAYQPVLIPNMPARTKHIKTIPSKDSTIMYLMVEESFQVRRISHKMCRQNSSTAPTISYEVAFPWTYFLFKMESANVTHESGWHITGWWVFMSNKRIRKQSDMLWPLSLPNTYSDGRVCFNYGSALQNNGTTLSDVIETTISGYWLSTFNMDLWPTYEMMPRDYGSFEKWQEASLQNPMIWQEWKHWEKKTELTMEKHTGKDGPSFDDPIVIEGTIPQIQMPPTFDRLDTWWNSIPDETRKRLTSKIIGDTFRSIKVPA